MLYRGMDRAQLDGAYNNSAAVAKREAIVADWAARSAKVRREYAGHLVGRREHSADSLLEIIRQNQSRM